MSKSAADFALDLHKFGEMTDKKLLNIVIKITLDLDRSVVLGTPVDTGRARGNWFPSVGSPSSEVNQNASDKSGAATLGKIEEVVGKVQIGNIVWLSNNLPYIVPLENGHSKQAPSGMVDINMSRVQAKYGGSVTR